MSHDEWDMDDLNAIDQQLANTPKHNAHDLSPTKKKRVGKRRSLMSKIEDQINNSEDMKGNRAIRRENRSSSMVIDSDDEELLQSINIFLLDGTQHHLRILPTTTVSNCLIILRDMLHLQNDADFALFVVKNGLLRGTCDVVPEHEKMLYFTQTWKPEQSERSLLDSGDLNDVIPGGTRHLIFKRRMYLPWSPIHDEVSNATSVTSTGHMLEYIESVHNVMYAQYPCNKQQVMELASLMIQAELGDYDKTIRLDKNKIIKKMDYILPGYFRENRRMAKYADRVIKLWKSNSGLSPLKCQQKYV